MTASSLADLYVASSSASALLSIAMLSKACELSEQLSLFFPQYFSKVCDIRICHMIAHLLQSISRRVKRRSRACLSFGACYLFDRRCDYGLGGVGRWPHPGGTSDHRGRLNASYLPIRMLHLDHVVVGRARSMRHNQKGENPRWQLRISAGMTTCRVTVSGHSNRRPATSVRPPECLGQSIGLTHL